MSRDKTSNKLTAIYQNHNNHDVKEKVITALFIQSNAKALIDIVRQEKDVTLKRRALKKLTLMDSEEAMSYLQQAIKILVVSVFLFSVL